MASPYPRMKPINPEFLKRANEEDVKYVFDAVETRNQAKFMRNNHFVGRKGYTKDKSMRLVGRFPMKMLFHPEFKKFFDVEMDAHERRKHIYKLLKKYPDFKTVENL